MKPERKSTDDWMLLSEKTTATPARKKKKPKPPPIYVEIDYPARLATASIAWALVGWLIAAAAPHLAFLPLIEALNYLLPAVTVGLIGGNLYFAVRDLWRGVHPLRLLVVTGLQIGLFTTLFFQFYAHLGAEYYDVDGPTSAWQWVMFSFGHALRASDVVDFIEAYSLRVQPIKHQSWFVALFVILYHVVIDVFVLAILWKAVARIKRRLMKDENVRFHVRWIAIAVFSLWLFAWIVVALVIRPWSPVDVPLWFLENVLRVIDFADIMESFDIQLHSLPREGINGTLTFVCCIFIGVGIAYLLGRKKKTADNRVMTPPDEDPLPYWAKRTSFVFAILFGICVFGMLSQLVMGNPAARLAEAVGSDSDESAQAALNGLRRMGPAAKAAIPTLLAVRERSAPPVTEDITRVLAYFGTGAIQPLTTIARGNEELSAIVAVESLGRIGAVSAGGIAETWSATSFESVRQAADRELRAMGSEAVPAIMGVTTLQNAERHYQWFQELDRNWRLRHTSNKVATALQSLPDHLRRLEMGYTAATFAEICAGLRNCGTAARKTAPKMLDALADKDASIASSAESVLIAIGPELTPELLRRADEIVAAVGNLDAADSQALIHALRGDERLPREKFAQQCAGLYRAVELLGPKLRAAAPAMAKFVMDPKTDLGHKYYIIEFMKPIGAEFEVIGPAMLSYLGESHESLRLIQNFGKDAVPHLGTMLDNKDPNPRYFAVWAAEKLRRTRACSRTCSTRTRSCGSWP